MAAVVLPLLTACSQMDLFDEPPIDSCAPGQRFTVTCGLCDTGTGWEECQADRSRLLVECDDPEDVDGDLWTRAGCDTRNPTCGGCSWADDCDDALAAVSPEASELCNDLDDDCDGETDEGFPCVRGTSDVPCTTTCGSTGTGVCTAACALPTPADCTPPAAESCNGIDDDCNGETDETFRCVPGTSVACVTICDWPNVGPCTDECDVPSREECPLLPESCNGADDDCDTTTDEGC